jgi:hypothetical protein
MEHEDRARYGGVPKFERPATDAQGLWCDGKSIDSALNGTANDGQTITRIIDDALPTISIHFDREQRLWRVTNQRGICSLPTNEVYVDVVLTLTEKPFRNDRGKIAGPIRVRRRDRTNDSIDSDGE